MSELFMYLHSKMFLRGRQVGPSMLSVLTRCVVSLLLGFLPSLPWCFRDEILGSSSSVRTSPQSCMAQSAHARNTDKNTM